MSKLIFDQEDNAEIICEQLNDAQELLREWLSLMLYNSKLIIRTIDSVYEFSYNKNKEPINKKINVI